MVMFRFLTELLAFAVLAVLAWKYVPELHDVARVILIAWTEAIGSATR